MFRLLGIMWSPMQRALSAACTMTSGRDAQEISAMVCVLHSAHLALVSRLSTLPSSAMQLAAESRDESILATAFLASFALSAPSCCNCARSGRPAALVPSRRRSLWGMGVLLLCTHSASSTSRMNRRAGEKSPLGYRASGSKDRGRRAGGFIVSCKNEARVSGNATTVQL